jgi:hypothetical protein
LAQVVAPAQRCKVGDDVERPRLDPNWMNRRIGARERAVGLEADGDRRGLAKARSPGRGRDG